MMKYISETRVLPSLITHIYNKSLSEVVNKIFTLAFTQEYPVGDSLLMLISHIDKEKSEEDNINTANVLTDLITNHSKHIF